MLAYRLLWTYFLPLPSFLPFALIQVLLVAVMKPLQFNLTFFVIMQGGPCQQSKEPYIHWAFLYFTWFSEEYLNWNVY